MYVNVQMGCRQTKENSKKKNPKYISQYTSDNINVEICITCTEMGIYISMDE